MTQLIAGMGWGLVAYSLLVVLGGAWVRGYSGFGFSLLVITALSLALPLTLVVPAVFLLEIAASLHLLPGIWRDIHWRSIAWLLAGCVAATPVGVWVLASVPPAPMQVGLGVFVLAAAMLLAYGFALQRMPGRWATLATGAAAGLLNGSIGIGGPPVILFYFASPAGAAAGRASMIAFFLLLDVVGTLYFAQQGLVTLDTLWRFLLFLPPLVLGVWLGNRGFLHADPAVFRRWVLRLVMLLAVMTGAQGALALLG